MPCVIYGFAFGSLRVPCSALVCLLTIGTFGCEGRVFSDPDALQAYLLAEGSPYSQTAVRGGVEFNLRYVPTEGLMVAYQRTAARRRAGVMADMSLDEATRASRLAALERDLTKRESAYRQNLHFVLTITPDDSDLVYGSLAQGRESYTAWLEKLLFGMGDVIALRVRGHGSIAPTSYHLERTYGVTSGRSFFLVFPAHIEGRDLRKRERLRVRINEFGLRTGAVDLSFPLPFPTVRLR